MTRLTHLSYLAPALLAMLAGCATHRPAGTAGTPAPVRGGGETIAVSVGPCFGFCPVYQVTVGSGGAVQFDGARHTAVLGERRGDKGAAGYRAVAAALAPYRPASGTTAETQCETRISDLQHYTIAWTAADGTRTVLEHDKGCRSTRNDALNQALEALPEQIGIADWARQTTRPGASRG